MNFAVMPDSDFKKGKLQIGPHRHLGAVFPFELVAALDLGRLKYYDCGIRLTNYVDVIVW